MPHLSHGHPVRAQTHPPIGGGPRGGQGKPVRLLTMVQRAQGQAPNQRFRHEQWAPVLQKEHGISLHFAPFESPELAEALARPGRGAKLWYGARDLLSLWRRRYDVRDYDGVVLLREAALVGGPWIERFIARSGVPFIYDFDDAIWLGRRDGLKWTSVIARMPWKVREIIRLADAVTVGSAHLAEFARRYNPDVTVVPTSVDLERFTVSEPPAIGRGQPFTIVWTGSRSTLQYVEWMRPALERLATRVPIRLRIVCDTPPGPFGAVQTEYVPWSPRVEVDALRTAHVGVMPLPDTPTARGKCACKALQYMAIGQPTVVSPIGINAELVKHDDNGLHATTHDQWVAQLERLAHDGILRARLGAAGRRTVERGYTSEIAAAGFAGVVRRVLMTKRAPLAAP